MVVGCIIQVFVGLHKSHAHMRNVCGGGGHLGCAWAAAAARASYFGRYNAHAPRPSVQERFHFNFTGTLLFKYYKNKTSPKHYIICVFLNRSFM